MPYKVFISYKHTALNGNGVTRDYAIAADLHRALSDAGVPTFFSEKDLSTSDYIQEIYSALDEAEIMIVVATRPEHINAQWVTEEWVTFIAAINGKRKPHAEIYTYLEGMGVNDLPMILYRRQSFTTGERDRLISRITAQLGISPSAKPAGVPAPSAKPAGVPANMKPVRLSAVNREVQVGTRIQFGKYPQGAKGQVEPLNWLMLGIERDRMLLITEKLIDHVKYNDNYESVVWETCTLRRWLNQDFLHAAFNESESARIAEVTLQNPDNPEYGTNGGRATRDKVFVLSIDEAAQYFLSASERTAYETACAFTKRGFMDRFMLAGNTVNWWLRTPGLNNLLTVAVSGCGDIIPSGLTVSQNRVAVRPALWVCRS